LPDPKVRKYFHKQYNAGAKIEERRYFVAII